MVAILDNFFRKFLPVNCQFCYNWRKAWNSLTYKIYVFNEMKTKNNVDTYNNMLSVF